MNKLDLLNSHPSSLFIETNNEATRQGFETVICLESQTKDGAAPHRP